MADEDGAAKEVSRRYRETRRKREGETTAIRFQPAVGEAYSAGRELTISTVSMLLLTLSFSTVVLATRAMYCLSMGLLGLLVRCDRRCRWRNLCLRMVQHDAAQGGELFPT